jgi:Na+/H+ antiporter NhaD/arsenite permease-like protein
MDMSFREKSAWACLVTTGVVFVPYFTFIAQLASRGELILPRVVVAFVAAVLAQIVLSSVYMTVIALRTRQEPRDERDTAIENRAFRGAHWTLVIALWIFVLGGGFLAPVFPQLISVVFVGQLALLSFVLSELVHYATLVHGYRRGY